MEIKWVEVISVKPSVMGAFEVSVVNLKTDEKEEYFFDPLLSPIKLIAAGYSFAWRCEVSPTSKKLMVYDSFAYRDPSDLLDSKGSFSRAIHGSAIDEMGNAPFNTFKYYAPSEPVKKTGKASRSW